MEKEPDGRRLCEKCGAEIEWADDLAYGYDQWVERKERDDIVHRTRWANHWKHKNGGLFDNVTGCDDPTPRNIKSTLVQCVKCDRMFDFTKEGEKWYDRKNDRTMAKCGGCCMYK